MIQSKLSIKTFYVAFTAVVCIVFSTFSIASTEFDTAWQEADKLRLESAAVNHEWTTAKKLLKNAKEAQTKGETDKAMKLVAKAKQQSLNALAQYDREKTAWKSRVPK